MGAAQKPATRRRGPRIGGLGGNNKLELKNRDARYHYVFVYRGDEDAVAVYSWKGYQEVKREKGGVEFAVKQFNPALGQSIEFRGHVLMALPKEDYDEDFQAAQEMADAKVRKMTHQSPTFIDESGQVRRIGSGYAPVENETTPLYQEAPAPYQEI